MAGQNTKLTIAQLKEIIEPRLDEASQRLDVLTHKVNEGGREMKGLKPQITRLHATHQAIAADVERLSLDVDNMFTSERNRAQLEEIINGRLTELNNSITGEFTHVYARINEVDGKVDALGVSHNKLAESHKGLAGRVNDIKVTIDASTRFPWGRAIIAAIVGIIAGVLWNIHNFSQTVKMNDGQPITIPDFRDDLWVAYLFGALVAVAVFGLMALFVRKNNGPDRPKDSDYNTDDVKYVQPVPRNTEPITQSIVDEHGMAPTKPIPAQGAPVGTP